MAIFQFLQSCFEALVDVRSALLFLGTFLALSWLAQSYLNQTKLNLPPGPKAWPIVGCLPQLLIKALPAFELLQELGKEYGPICHVPAPFGKRAVIISGYQAVYEALTEFSWRPPRSQGHLDELLKGSGVANSSGDQWKEIRRFSQQILRGAGVAKRSLEDQIATESECLMKEIGSQQGNPFDPMHLFCNATSNVICSVVLGKRFEYNDPEFKHLLHLLDDSISHAGVDVLLMTVPSLSKIPFFPKGSIPSHLLLRQKLKDIVDDHRATFDAENLRDFIDAYINDMSVKKERDIQTYFSDLELIAIIHDLFTAGTETTSTTLRWALLYMLNFPDVQKRVHDEMDAVVGGDRLPRLLDKSKLPYTEAVIHEIQRFACIAYITNRYTEQDTQFQGSTIPKGTMLVPNLFSVTRDPSVWEDPDVFKPERFLDENGQVMRVQGQLVFGAGKRVCLGEQLARMELFIFFTHLMHQFSFEKPSTVENLNIQPKQGLVLAPFPYKICAIIR